MDTQDNDVLEFAVIHDNSVSGEQMNRYQYQISTPSPVDDAGILVDLAVLVEALYAIVQGMIAWHNSLREVRVINRTQERIIGSCMAGTYVGGTLTGDDAPQGVSAYVHLTTNVPKVILSKYLPSATVTAINADGGLWSAGMTMLAAFAGALLAPHVSGAKTYTYGYFSPKTSTFVLPQVAVAHGVFGYQRRRKKGRGA